MEKPKFLIVDGHSLAFRSYYAFAYRGEGGLRTSTGIPTSVTYGFLKSLLDILAKEKPEAVAIAFDLGEPTFRHGADENYKAGRPETPADFLPDLANLQQVLAAMNLQIVTAPGFEADDVIGTLVQLGIKADYQVKILSGDQDLFQLIDDGRDIAVLHLGKGDQVTEFHSAEVVQKLGVHPTQVIDFKSLCGDSSDNIPGVRGIGEKTAAKLLQEYKSLEGIFNNLDKIQKGIAQKLIAGKESAYHSQSLARIVTDVPLDVTMDAFVLQGFDRDQVIPLLEKLELRTFMRKIDEIEAQLSNNIKLETEADELWFDFQATQPLTLATITLDVQIIDTTAKLESLAARLRNCDHPIAWDTESTALRPHEAQVVGIGCCWGKAMNQVAYIPLHHTEGSNLDLGDFLRVIKPILEDENSPKVMQNAKFDRLVLRTMGIELRGLVFDTMLASYVLDPEASHNLRDLAARYLQLACTTYTDLVGKLPSIADVAIPQVAHYCATDAYFTFCLLPLLQAELEQVPELKKLFYDVELPLEKVLADMEWVGIRIDRDYLLQFAQEIEQDLAAIAHKAYGTVNREFNLNSPKQLSEILVELLGENFTKKSRKTANGYSTDVAVLNKLQGEHPLIDLILEHRHLAKLKSTYVDVLPTLISPKTDRVHTDFNQVNTSTGRLSSSNPNLQNIPIRTSFSRRIRLGFLPQEGWLLLSADYSQIELRILAHLSQEPALIEAYNKGIDVHTLTAQLLLEKQEISSEERRLAKVINYGVIYGMGAQKFSRQTGISVKEAKRFIDAFADRYRCIFNYMRQVERQAERDGFVCTILGRRRYFRELKTATGKKKADLLRAAVNAPIQGTSADIIKLAMIKLHALLQNYQASLLLQVHDELVLEIPPAEVDILAPQIKQTMETALHLSVPLVVDIHVGKNWMESK
ncbi:MAG: DNA polymerase I [Pseudanabaenaceae cyanobacterium SKYGB_i_bin29]|nr:DNA polymerase I [Pseudanabaenaceae cyanobacterium SKYG29]MDW8421022.1 DNA polymerase I [Pseudanabaenaceae cyanobacterium SKYGB_i_bin29]